MGRRIHAYSNTFSLLLYMYMCVCVCVCVCLCVCVSIANNSEVSIKTHRFVTEWMTGFRFRVWGFVLLAHKKRPMNTVPCIMRALMVSTSCPPWN